MGIKIVYSCDGCSKQINQEDVEATNQTYLNWASSKNVEASTRPSNPEILCFSCRERAMEFWDSKAQMMDGLLKELRNRAERHKNKFWEQVRKPSLTVMK